MAIQLPGSKGSQDYIKATEVTFKSKSGLYRYYDTESHEVPTFKGVIVGAGFQFITTRLATKKKGLTLVSSEFGWDVMKNGKIKMRELKRENGEFSSSSVGEKTYKEWKDEGLKAARVVFVIGEDGEIYKLVFSGKAFMMASKFITDDIPNFVVEFGVSEEAESGENGDFFTPTFAKVGPLPPAREDEIVTWIKEVDRILNKKTQPSISSQEATGVFDDGADSDIPF